MAEARLFREGVKDADKVIGECRRCGGHRGLDLVVVPPNYEQFREVEVRAGLKPSNDFHVLLRHRPRSIPKAALPVWSEKAHFSS